MGIRVRMIDSFRSRRRLLRLSSLSLFLDKKERESNVSRLELPDFDRSGTGPLGSLPPRPLFEPHPWSNGRALKLPKPPCFKSGNDEVILVISMETTC